MKKDSEHRFFDSIDFVSIVDTIKGVYMSDGAMARLLDYERVLDEADIYAFKNWSYGELVQGPDSGRYKTTCVFMWPCKLMPDPRGALRLTKIGCDVVFGKSSIQVPVEVEEYSDFVPGTRYPKMQKKSVWYVQISIPVELMDDIKEGSVEIADATLDLSELEDAYDDDLDDVGTEQEAGGMGGMGDDFGGDIDLTQEPEI